MLKKYFAVSLLSLAISVPAFAEDAVFKNTDTEHFQLKPLSFNTKPVVKSEEIPVVKSNSIATPNVAPATKNDLSNQNFLNAINNLDNAQVEVREQMATYSALMAQAKSQYEAKKAEYNGYKKQYNQLKRKMNSIEKSKSMIQNNVNVQNKTN